MNRSPFPGMDPYLEGEMWQEFHDRLANQISIQLLPKILPKYVALLNKYYMLDVGLSTLGFVPGDSIYPDVHIVKPPHDYGGVALAEPRVTTPILTLTSPMPHEVPLLQVEIRDVAQRQLVTVIEILSPVDKRAPSYDLYQQKREKLLYTPTHLLEIDLLRGGKRLAFVEQELLPPKPYFVFLSRVNRRPLTDIWPINLADPLPVVPVPLLPPDPDVPLDLQAALTACFELVGYQRLLDYTQPPPPPVMESHDLDWLRKQITPAPSFQS